MTSPTFSVLCVGRVKPTQELSDYQRYVLTVATFDTLEEAEEHAADLRNRLKLKGA